MPFTASAPSLDDQDFKLMSPAPSTADPSKMLRTPMMQQWTQCKASAPDALLLFRMGDFYEAFQEDASQLASYLEIQLTQRGGIQMAGVPVASLEVTLSKLAGLGVKTAIVEQMQDPKTTKGLVPREIVRVITPGSWSPDQEQNSSNFLVALADHQNERALICGDLATGVWSAYSFEGPSAMSQIAATLFKLAPSELVVTSSFAQNSSSWLEEQKQNLGLSLTKLTAPSLNDALSKEQRAQEIILSKLKVHNLDHLGISAYPALVCSLGMWLSYVSEELRSPVHQMGKLQLMMKQKTMLLDRITLRNLEVTEPLYQEASQRGEQRGETRAKKTTLLGCIDCTKSAAGARLLREWLLNPLTEVDALLARQEAVASLLEPSHMHLLSDLGEQLGKIRDLERLGSKIALQKASPLDLLALAKTLELLPSLIETIAPLKGGMWPLLQETLDPLPALHQELASMLALEKLNSATKVGEGELLREGLDEALDEWKKVRDESHAWLFNYQQSLKEELELKNLKVGYTPAFGYYIEVSKAQAAKMPPSFRRRQTLVNAERFLTPELKEFEEKVLSAKDKIAQIEAELYEQLLIRIKGHHEALLHNARALARIDVLYSFAQKAKRHHYCPPQFVREGNLLQIEEGRHPIIEEQIGRERFIANATHFDPSFCQLALITGPNMAGKSTYIRQVAILTLLAQIGSFVPAKSMRLSLCDRIFTRVGASDDLARGQSTFMVEMSEAAHILNHATSHSLVILDEVGRGTSTRDGVAIAQAMAEFLVSDLICRPKTLFATHYWELTELEPSYAPRIKNFHIAVCEERGQVTFLHHIKEGSSQRSYGVHVAKLAGVPSSIIERAQRLTELHDAAAQDPFARASRQEALAAPPATTPSIESPERREEREILERMRSLEPNELTPLQALEQLIAFKERIGTLPWAKEKERA